jgi:hypothetical protein
MLSKLTTDSGFHLYVFLSEIYAIIYFFINMFKTNFCLFTALLILASTAQILKGTPTPLGSMGPAPIALQ